MLPRGAGVLEILPAGCTDPFYRTFATWDSTLRHHSLTGEQRGEANAVDAAAHNCTSFPCSPCTTLV